MSDTTVASLLDQVENYEQTVRALLAFSALVVHDGGSVRQNAHFGIGRRMNTSSENDVRSDHEITPDLVAQRSSEYGIVAELKKSLNQKTEYWSRLITRLRKYDDDLDGWWTDSGHIDHSDATLIIHQSRSRKFVRYLREQVDAGTIELRPSSSVVEFNSSEETANYYFFRLEYGKIADQRLSAALVDGTSVPLDKVLRSFPTLKYYDAVPPLPRLLVDLWFDVFSSRIEREMFDEETRIHYIPVSLSEMTIELQRAYGSSGLEFDSRSTEFPKAKWIRAALKFLVDQGMAARDEDDTDKYIIRYKTMRGDVLRRFTEMVVSAEAQSDKDDSQQDLFEED